MVDDLWVSSSRSASAYALKADGRSLKNQKGGSKHWQAPARHCASDDAGWRQKTGCRRGITGNSRVLFHRDRRPGGYGHALSGHQSNGGSSDDPLLELAKEN